MPEDMSFVSVEDNSSEITYPLIPLRDYMDGKVYAFTDGALSRCKRTDIQFGGWGVFVTYMKHERRLSGAKVNTSTQEMELEAVLQAVILLTAKEHSKQVRVFIDNKWVVESIQRALIEYRQCGNKWPSKAWVLSQGRNGTLKTTVRNIVEKATPSFTFYWVKGHSNVSGNDQADKLAVAARQKLKELYLVDGLEDIPQRNGSDNLGQEKGKVRT